MGGNYSFPMTSKFSIEMNAWNSENVVVSMQGKRDTDEDAALLLVPIPNFSNCRVTGIFDGHNGSRTSLHCVRRIASILGECKSLSQAEIENACIKLDREIRGTIYKEEGSTGIFVIVEKLNVDGEFRLRVCNVGDSRCLLIRTDGMYEKLSDDHKPTLPLEKLRIEKANGVVSMDRVNGNMAVSRAFGDTWYKRNNKLSENEQLITCIPDVQETNASAGDIIVLACDGIYEQLSWDDVAAFCQQQLNNNRSLYETAISLIDHSLVLGSLDNMTVLLVRLTKKEFERQHVSYEYLPGIVFNSLNDRSDQMIRLVEELKSMGMDFETIQEVLSISPKFGEKEIFSLPIFLGALLAEQRKLKTLKICSFESENVHEKNRDFLENTLHYIPFDAKRLKEIGGNEIIVCKNDNGSCSLRLNKEEETKDDRSVWYSDNEDEAKMNVKSKLSQEIENRNFIDLFKGNKDEEEEQEQEEQEEQEQEEQEEEGKERLNNNFCGSSTSNTKNDNLDNNNQTNNCNSALNTQEEFIQEKEDEEYIYYDAVESKIDLKNTNQISVHL